MLGWLTLAHTGFPSSSKDALCQQSLPRCGSARVLQAAWLQIPSTITVINPGASKAGGGGGVSAAESQGFHPEAFLIYEKESRGLHLPAVAREMETATGSAQGDFPVLVQGGCKVSPQHFPRPWGCPAGEFRLLRPKVPSCRTR